MNISEVKKENCCGCTACMAVCPKSAITMKEDSEGFIYPAVDKSRCIECGLCLNTCQYKVNIKTNLISSYAAKNKLDDVLIRSSSGGVSHALCKAILERNGIVYGVAYNKNYEVITTRADNLEACNAFYGSKYVQTNPLDTFKAVYNDLHEKKEVLYFGTSCHIAGLKSYLNTCRIDTSRLYTVDLICHGVPSPKVFASYIDWLRRDKNFESFEFRTKHKPWGYGSKNFGCTIRSKNGNEYFDTLKSRAFLSIFFSNNCLRPHCHQCNFSGVDKPADLTIADYWGCLEQEPDFFSEKGVSAVLVHTEKGNSLLKESDELVLKETTIDKIKIKQGNLDHPSPIGDKRDEFWNAFYKYGFEYVAKKYGPYNFMGFLRNSKLYELYSKIRSCGRDK